MSQKKQQYNICLNISRKAAIYTGASIFQEKTAIQSETKQQYNINSSIISTAQNTSEKIEM